MSPALQVTVDLTLRSGRATVRVRGDRDTIWFEPVGWRGSSALLRTALRATRQLGRLRRAAGVLPGLQHARVGLRVGGLPVARMRLSRPTKEALP